MNSYTYSTTKGNEQNKQKKFLKHWRIIALYLMLYDIVAVNFSYFFGLWIRFDLHYSQIPTEYLECFLRFAPFYTVLTIFIFYQLRLYNSLWRFASFSELNRIFLATLLTTAVHILGITVCIHRMPISYYLFGALLQFVLITSVRFLYRYITLLRARRERAESVTHNAMIIGAGQAGLVILKELNTCSEASSKACCIIDDNANKWGRYIENVPIVGGRDSILEAVERYHIHEIFIAMPSASPQVRRDILNICKETKCELKTLPGIYQVTNGEVSLSQMKPVDVEDLLGREPIKVNMEEICTYIEGKVILITGGGGSIGSELCRQIAEHHPKQLIIFDIYENNAYEIEQELKKTHPELNLKVLIGSVRDSRRVNRIFENFKPEIVYHAAAHKHVPLMESSPCEAIKNNALGTYKVAYAAMMNGCSRFVLISTDKAVNPTNIMGASKRLCEMIIQSFDRISKEGAYDKIPVLYAHADDEDGAVDRKSAPKLNEKTAKTEFVAVRFGNVLGSNGSVIPLFKKQIESGGPVTVTHPDIIRYFMTIPEAVSLVLQAGTYAEGGEIFVLDMGQPVKIDTLARNLIQLSGYKPDVDIKVEYTGLRPGEKLFEEKLMSEEGMKTTKNELIHIGSPIPFDTDKFLEQMKTLMAASYENSGDIQSLVEHMVSTYHPENAGKASKAHAPEISEEQKILSFRPQRGYGEGQGNRNNYINV